MHIFSFLFLIVIFGLFGVTSLSVCAPCYDNTVTSPYSHTGLLLLLLLLLLCVCVRACHFSVVSMPNASHTGFIFVVIVVFFLFVSFVFLACFLCSY